jgi:hypothetical protein
MAQPSRRLPACRSRRAGEDRPAVSATAAESLYLLHLSSRFKSAQQRAARRQASPDRSIEMENVALRRSAKCTARLVKATSLHFATQHIWQTF